MAISTTTLPVNTTFRENASGVPIISGKSVQVTKQSSVFGSDGLSFKDVLDSVNPLQQLPGVGMLYRAGTGDSISPAAKIAGGALFGGPIGAILGAVDAVVELASGASVGDHLLSAATATPAATTVTPPPVSEEVAQVLANDALEKEAVAKAEEQAKKDEVAKAELDFLSLRKPEAIDAAEAAKQVDGKSGIALNKASAGAQFVYERQERVYANAQAMEGLYSSVVDTL